MVDLEISRTERMERPRARRAGQETHKKGEKVHKKALLAAEVYLEPPIVTARQQRHSCCGWYRYGNVSDERRARVSISRSSRAVAASAGRREKDDGRCRSSSSERDRLKDDDEEDTIRCWGDDGIR